MADLNVVVPEHPPEVTDSVGKRTLGGYVGNLVIQTLWGGREGEREKEGERSINNSGILYIQYTYFCYKNRGHKN